VSKIELNILYVCMYSSTCVCVCVCVGKGSKRVRQRGPHISRVDRNAVTDALTQHTPHLHPIQPTPHVHSTTAWIEVSM
jgi:hypothetical protein